MNPLTSATSRQIMLDFGTREHIELSQQRKQSDFQQQHKHIHLLNVSTLNSINWIVKFGNTQTSSTSDPSSHSLCPFEPLAFNGTLTPGETLLLPFKFLGNSLGVFESVAEIGSQSLSDKSAKTNKVTTMLCRSTLVTSNLHGLPNLIDFGNTVVPQESIRTFTIKNAGTAVVTVTVLAKDPVFVTPHEFQLLRDAQQEIVLKFIPRESTSLDARVHVFFNQFCQSIVVRGVGGMVRLLMNPKEIDFGECREGIVAWRQFTFTNTGSLPLTLGYLTCPTPHLIRVQTTSSTATATNSISLTRNPWLICKRKLWKLLKHSGALQAASCQSVAHRSPSLSLAVTVDSNLILSDQSAHISSRAASAVDDSQTQQHTHHHLHRHHSLLPISSEKEFLLEQIPPLAPFATLHLKIGFVSCWQVRKRIPLTLHYQYEPHLRKSIDKRVPHNHAPTASTTDPIDVIMEHLESHQENDSPSISPPPTTNLKFSSSQNMQIIWIEGSVTRPLDIHPLHFDFGHCPAEEFLSEKQHQRLFNDGNVLDEFFGARSLGMTPASGYYGSKPLPLTFTNFSFRPQTVELIHLTSQWTCATHSWHLAAGSSIDSFPFELCTSCAWPS